ncbi:MAG: hypothetical protein ACHQF2_05755, partial [Flavobacteriales bacterium]
MQRYLHILLPWLAFTAGMCYFCLGILGYDLTYIPGDKGDSRYINYLLEHGYQWICGDVSTFWNAPFMHPFENTIALSDNMLGSMPIYSFWRSIGMPSETAYQFWWLTICALNYWITFYIIKKWIGDWRTAVLMAWIFAFTIFNMGQLNYMQMTLRFMVPVVFYAGYKMIETPAVKYAVWFMVGITFQFYCVIYTGLYLFYFSMLFLILYVFLSRKWKNIMFYFKGKQLLYVGVTLIICTISILWLYKPYARMAVITGYRLYEDVKWNLPLLQSFLFPHETSTTWFFLHRAMIPENSIWWLQYNFLGVVPVLTFLTIPFVGTYSLIKKTKFPSWLWACAIAAVCVVLVHLRTESGASLYRYIYNLPGVAGIRVCSRFLNV